FYLFNSEYYLIFFFFQAEDGIRDFHVTGVQTCALPIFRGITRQNVRTETVRVERLIFCQHNLQCGGLELRVEGIYHKRVRTEQRSEERRVGKEGRSRGGT